MSFFWFQHLKVKNTKKQLLKIKSKYIIKFFNKKRKKKKEITQIRHNLLINPFILCDPVYVKPS